MDTSGRVTDAKESVTATKYDTPENYQHVLNCHWRATNNNYKSTIHELVKRVTSV